MNGHHPSHKVLLYCVIFTKVYIYIYIYIYISFYIAIYNNYTYSAGMKERCRDGCRTSLLIAGVVLVSAIFHTLLPPCHPYITTHFMEMIFFTCTNIEDQQLNCIVSSRSSFLHVATGHTENFSNSWNRKLCFQQICQLIVENRKPRSSNVPCETVRTT